MLKRVIGVALCVSSAFAQVIHQAQLKPVNLKLQVIYDTDNTRVQVAEVELMDSVGSSSAMDKQEVNRDGEVTFRTLTGGHRVRITGPDIQTWEGEFQIMPNEVNHTENIRVQPRNAAERSVRTDTVSALRLKIPKGARKQYEAGMKALQKQQWADARTRFESAIGAYDKYDLAYNGLGVVEINLKDNLAARSAFMRALELNPAYAEALRNLARMELAENRYAEAIDLLERSLNTEPTNVWAVVSIAYANLESKKYDEAVAWALKVRELPPPRDPTAHYIAGCALGALGKRAEAVQELEAYLREEPQGPNAKGAREYLSQLSASE